MTAGDDARAEPGGPPADRTVAAGRGWSPLFRAVRAEYPVCHVKWTATGTSSTGQLVPPEYLGAQVSAPFSHQTGRYLPLSIRCATALFGHLGIEWDLTQASPDELARADRPRRAGRDAVSQLSSPDAVTWRTAYSRAMRGAVTVHVAAPPVRCWDLVTDLSRIGEFSPETFEAEWLAGADGPGTGARFRGHVRRNGRGPVYWTTCTVIASDPGREFAFSVAGPGGRPVNTWRYVLRPRADGTDITESFELSDLLATRVYWLLAGRARKRTNLSGMRATLENIKAAAESKR